MQRADRNPILKMDYPDPDVIRVDDTYYMISTTMHFMPGGVILRSYDLEHWEIVSYIFEKLDDTPEERLERECNCYGHGMWAASLRYHEGTFYACFVSHGKDKTYLFTTGDITGEWKRSWIEGYYHDNSLLFDEDGRVYIVYGNSDIWLTELKEDLSGPKENGLHRRIITEKAEVILGYEGAHIYKRNGRYYLFLIHWPKATGRRTQACFTADSLEGDFKGKDIFDDDMGYFNQGIAQGGIVDTPSGKWYAILFQDMGAAGRIPVLIPMKWEEDFPVIGENGRVPRKIGIASSRPYYRYQPLYTSDDFRYSLSEGKHPQMKLQWQWNHQPDPRYWEIIPAGGLRLQTNKLCINVTQAVNTLTQRMLFPESEASVEVDGSALKDGDVAGLCGLQGSYGLLGITRESGNYYLVKITRSTGNLPVTSRKGDFMPGDMSEKIKLPEARVKICLKATFEGRQDKLEFFYQKEGKWVRVGEKHQLQFRLDHFTGCRYGLFIYATKETGGSALFRNFEYDGD